MKASSRTAARRGFTLVELLVVISIIGTLSTMAVVSYSSARASARDTKRASDMKQLQTAVELYFENHQVYPFDQTPGNNGLILGLQETRMLSDGGFGPQVVGTPYMIGVPRNPQPGGSEYVYRSLTRDGENCDEPEGCDNYAILFTLERDSGSYRSGPHAMTPAGVAGAEGGYAGEGIVGAGESIVGLDSTQELLARYAETATVAVVEFVDDERVETAATIAAPAVVAVGVANTAAAAQSASSFGSFLLYFFTQPFLLLGRRKRESWGVVYNALSKLPVDLATVRLRDARSGRLVKSTVTDGEGRYSFLAPRGTYRIEVAKADIVFPSQVVTEKEDAQYTDVYHGESIDVVTDGALLTPNIPVDPRQKEETDVAVLRKERSKKIRGAVAVLGPVFASGMFAISPSIFTGLLFAAQVVTYMLFRRLAITPEPKQWGIVYERGSGKVVPQAVLRIFALPYHKLLETQVADRNGRYHFRVGSNVYYLTVTKPGYSKTESEPLDLSQATEPTVIASNIPLQPAQGAAQAVTTGEKKSLLVGPAQKGPAASPSPAQTPAEAPSPETPPPTTPPSAAAVPKDLAALQQLVDKEKAAPTEPPAPPTEPPPPAPPTPPIEPPPPPQPPPIEPPPDKEPPRTPSIQLE